MAIAPKSFSPQFAQRLALYQQHRPYHNEAATGAARPPSPRRLSRHARRPISLGLPLRYGSRVAGDERAPMRSIGRPSPRSLSADFPSSAI